MPEPTEATISAFIDEYIQALSKIVEKMKKAILDTNIKPSFPIDFPVKASVFLAEKGLIIYFEKAEKFSVAFTKERPSQRNDSGEFIPYRFFEAWKDKADKKAKSDVDSLLALPTMLEQHEEEQQAYYEALQIEGMQFDIDSYIDFLNKSNEAVAKTKDSALGEVYDLVTVRQKFLRNFEYFLRVGCEALNDLYFLIDSEMETSFDLALHGRYIPAMASLRKVFEVTMRALYIDCQKDRNLARQEFSDWIDQSQNGPSFRNVIEAIIPKEVDEELTKVLNEVGVFKGKSYSQELYHNLYRKLCTFVHLRPKTYNYDLELIYPEYIEQLFTDYHDTFYSIMSAFEALLVFNFPQIIEIQGLGSATEKYNLLRLSDEQCKRLSSYQRQKVSLKK
jgi:hypothetical protein